MWLIFAAEDREGLGLISLNDFYAKIVKHQRNFFSDAMLEFIEADNHNHISFGEFMEYICIFCLFEKYDMLRFLFYILDKKKTGTIDARELKSCLYSLHDGELKSNAVLGFAEIAKLPTVDGRIGFREVAILHRRYPHIMYPVFRLQICLQRVGLGEKWWENRKIILSEEARILKQRDRTKEEAALKKLKLQEIHEDVRAKEMMGKFVYYTMPWRRKHFRRKLLKLEELEREISAKLSNDDDSYDVDSLSGAEKYITLRTIDSVTTVEA
eukprot:CAMPEP_0185026354 /NCGR_PEP_ID=MMETSP1103-20130426/10381_1 /TAXON_ID=36769 /ORGANISM="Paraphysomonas bandaiensis, Strain Caron Lab Isolate" /LENGTH=268 /DNA_ID=CAMNT_0027559907 /DNA_START=120 /DNA_END=926 /DNA_ORIENTATION=+